VNEQGKRPTFRPIWLALFLASIAIGFSFGLGLRQRYEAGQTLFGPEGGWVLRSDLGEEPVPVFGVLTAGEYFESVRRILKTEFYQPIEDETPLAQKAIASLVSSLGDPGCRYFDPEEWKVQRAREQGRYLGIGADVQVIPTAPRGEGELEIVVVSVMDKSPAEKAGLQPGDVIEAVGDLWESLSALRAEWESLRARYRKKEITQEQYQNELDQARLRIHQMKTLDVALRALTMSQGSRLRLQIRRNDKRWKVEVTTGQTEVPPVEQVEGKIRLRYFAPGVDATLQRLLNDLPSHQPVILDLRNNPGGSWEVMTACLSLLIPSGEFVKIQSDKKAPLQSLSLAHGQEKLRNVEVWVNKGTAREAEVFASALKERASAVVKGGQTFGLGIKTRAFPLPDGGAYTLTVGRLYTLKGTPLYTLEQTPASAKTSPSENPEKGREKP
jgi:carboxyl-terminal processing protease